MRHAASAMSNHMVTSIATTRRARGGDKRGARYAQQALPPDAAAMRKPEYAARADFDATPRCYADATRVRASSAAPAMPNHARLFEYGDNPNRDNRRLHDVACRRYVAPRSMMRERGARTDADARGGAQNGAANRESARDERDARVRQTRLRQIRQHCP